MGWIVGPRNPQEMSDLLNLRDGALVHGVPEKCNNMLFESFVEFAIQVIEVIEVTDVIEVSDNMLLIGVARGSCNGQMSEILVAVRRSTHAPAGQPPNCIE